MQFIYKVNIKIINNTEIVCDNTDIKTWIIIINKYSKINLNESHNEHIFRVS